MSVWSVYIVMYHEGVLMWHGRVTSQDVKEVKVGVNTQPHMYSVCVVVMQNEPRDNTDFTFVMAWSRGRFGHVAQEQLTEVALKYHAQCRSVVVGERHSWKYLSLLPTMYDYREGGK